MSKKFQVIVADPPWNFKDSLTMSDVPRGAAANYSIMSNSDIIGLDVKNIADPEGCVLALWVPGSLLQEGLNTMKSWGFEHKQTYVWVKTKKEPLDLLRKDLMKAAIHGIKLLKKASLIAGVKVIIRDVALPIAGLTSLFDLNSTLGFYMGRLFRQTHEICLIGINNKKIYKKLMNKSQRSVSFAENLKHSAKPDHLQNSLEIMFPNTKKLEMFARRHLPGWTCIGNEICNGEDIRDSLKKIF